MDSWNGTGLIRAAERGHHLVVGRLLQAGIDQDHVNRIGYQAIHEAVWFGADAADELATVQVLVAGGVELDRPSVSEGLTPLEMARERGYPTLERVLASAQRHRASDEPDAVLLAAAASGDADAVALALRDGADLEARDAAGRTALLLASAGDHVEVARVLVALGADRSGSASARGQRSSNSDSVSRTSPRTTDPTLPERSWIRVVATDRTCWHWADERAPNRLPSSGSMTTSVPLRRIVRVNGTT